MEQLRYVGLCWTEGREKQNIVLKWSGVHVMSKNEMVKNKEDGKFSRLEKR